ncbi:hypothetical protein J2T09_005453 [Neorhizobium huautlense]|uniref:Uncharacterized protein n=1 Tax=Neorhizobium huautlense TaxID=67774 RepID=A0ABT9Q2J0_9HYPH|nr:hypothetical protein [Neorhizobium huautlense]
MSVRGNIIGDYEATAGKVRTVAAIEKKNAQDAAILSQWRTVSVSTDFAAD